MADGTLQPITYHVTLSLVIGDHSEDLTFQVIKLTPAPIILGMTWLEFHNPRINWSTKKIAFDRPECRPHLLSLVGMDHSLFPISYQCFSATEAPPCVSSSLPPEYLDYSDVFQEREAHELPPHRAHMDHAINLQLGTTPPFGPLYSMTQQELTVLKEYLDEILAKGFIRPSSLPAAAPVFFVPKSHSTSLRLVVNYRRINDITIKNKYPLPLIDETLQQMAGAKLFTRLDPASRLPPPSDSKRRRMENSLPYSLRPLRIPCSPLWTHQRARHHAAIH